MQPYRSSLSGRIVSGTIAFALIGGGMIPAVGIDPSIGLPIVFLLSVVGCIVGLVLGVHDQTAAVALLAITLPLFFWAYVLGLLVIIAKAPAFGLALIGLGAGLAILDLVAPFVKFSDDEEPAIASFGGNHAR